MPGAQQRGGRGGGGGGYGGHGEGGYEEEEALLTLSEANTVSLAVAVHATARLGRWESLLTTL
jgi:hypothetical protein